MIANLQAQIDELKAQRGVPPAAAPSAPVAAAPPAPIAAPAAVDRDAFAKIVREELKLVEEEKKEKSPRQFRVYWKDGFRFDSLDDTFKLKLGGRVQMDWTFARQDEDLDKNPGGLSGWGHQSDGFEFRRARLYAAGTIHDEVIFKTQFDFAGDGHGKIRDIYIGLKHVTYVGRVRVGNQYEPFSISLLTSDKYITFLERGLPSEGLFAPGRNPGVRIDNHVLDDRVTYAVGLYRTHDDNFANADGDGEIAVTGRLTGLPYYGDKGRRLVHVGAAVSRRWAGDTFRFRQRPENHSAGRLIDTGSFRADDVLLLGLENAYVFGPLAVQAEYIRSYVDVNSPATSTQFRNVHFDGYYAQASYFLTGEHRPYKKEDGYFGRVKPKKSFSLKGGGLGAWELAARYSHANLDDDTIRGGTEDNVTLGLNWYWNPAVRIMVNYVMANVDRVASNRRKYSADANYLLMRFQVDF